VLVTVWDSNLSVATATCPLAATGFLSGGHHGARSVVAEEAVHEPAIDDGRVGGRAGVEPHRAPYGQRPMVDSKALMRWRMSPSRSRTPRMSRHNLTVAPAQ
jgi:hypothetical protein